MKKIVLGLTVFVGFALTFGIGYLVGGNGDIYKKDKAQKESYAPLLRVSGIRSGGAGVQMDNFWKVWDKIRNEYVNPEIEQEEMYYSAIEGLIAGLDDPYSEFFPPEKAKDFNESLSGKFEGIGAHIGLGGEGERISIIAPLPDSPAENAGLVTGDLIYSIDGEDSTGLSLDEAVTKIRGDRGTTVTLGILSKGDGAEVRDVRIVRDKIKIPVVELEMKTDDIAYIRIAYFNEQTTAEFRRVVSEMLNSDTRPRGLILDLRSNPGGFLDSAVDIASEWTPENGMVIVKEKGRPGVERVHSSSGNHSLVGMPTVILVDEGSASASEILAGALQDYEAATIIGRQTFGKGSVQNYEMLPDGSSVKLTVAKWYTPHENQIDEIGVTPHVVVEIDEEELQKKLDAGQSFSDIDPDVLKAIEILNSKI